MGDKMIEAIAVVATGVIGLAIFAVLLSKNSQTPAVINAAGSSFAGILGAALSPVNGGGTNIAGILGGLMGSNPLMNSGASGNPLSFGI